MPLKARNIKRKVEQLFRRADSEWAQKTTAALGNADGVVKSDTDGLIYARLRNGETVKVYNDIAPDDFDVRVLIGRKKEQPTLWRVIAVRDAYAIPQAPRVKYHAEQHMFRAPDEIPIDRKQIIQLTIIVSDGTAFTITVYGGVIRTATGIARVDTQPMDLSSYIPTTGAVYVSIEADSTGEVTANEGVNFASPLIAHVSYIPVPDAGKYMIGYVLLWEGMEELTDDQIAVPFPLAADYSGLGGGTQIHDADEETTLADDDEFGFWQEVSETFKKITWANIVAALTTIFDALYAAIGHTHAADDSGKVVMEDGVTFPPVPVTTEDGTDWIYSD